MKTRPRGARCITIADTRFPRHSARPRGRCAVGVQADHFVHGDARHLEFHWVGPSFCSGMRAPPSNVAEVSEAGPTLSRTTTSVVMRNRGPRENAGAAARRADPEKLTRCTRYRSAGRSRPPRSGGCDGDFPAQRRARAHHPMRKVQDRARVETRRGKPSSRAENSCARAEYRSARAAGTRDRRVIRRVTRTGCAGA